MKLGDLEAFGEPGAIVYLADCVDLMKIMSSGCVDMIFADPPYRLSNGGVTVKNGRLAPVDKGAWDRSTGFESDHRYNVGWLREARRILKPDGTIWVTGTHHIIFSLGFALQSMNFKLINQITWHKPDPPPNALHTAFTQAKAVVVRPVGTFLVTWEGDSRKSAVGVSPERLEYLLDLEIWTTRESSRRS